MLTKGREVCYDIMRVQETAPSYGEMSEWLKEPVLKTGGAQVPVGSNPTLSAKFIKLHPDTRKYPSGRRGSPAKGVGWIKPARGFKSLLPRQQEPCNHCGYRALAVRFPWPLFGLGNRLYKPLHPAGGLLTSCRTVSIFPLVKAARQTPKAAENREQRLPVSWRVGAVAPQQTAPGI